MWNLSFVTGLALIALAMLLRFGVGSPDPSHLRAADAGPESPPSPDAAAGSDQAAATDQPPEGEPTVPPPEPKLMLPSIPAIEPSPALNAFAGESIPRLKQRLQVYRERHDSARALLAVERLIESGAADHQPGLWEDWAQLQDEAPLWNPDIKLRQPFSLHIEITHPEAGSFDKSQLSSRWQQELLTATGGLFATDLHLAIRKDDAAGVRLDKGDAIPLAPDADLVAIEAAIGSLLRARAEATQTKPAPLRLALTRQQWATLQ